jgi:hypothetical protein
MLSKTMCDYCKMRCKIMYYTTELTNVSISILIILISNKLGCEVRWLDLDPWLIDPGVDEQEP